jgi:3',5'-cyclic AMP phosphodiesterase CpdA
MRRLAHLSDLHFGRVDPKVVEGLVRDLEADPPDLIVASGDFAQTGALDEFRAARAFLDRLKAPVFAVPGNHDVPYFHLLQRFFDPYRRYRRYIAPEVEPVWHDDQVALVGVKTSRRALPELNWSHGRISRRQLRRVLDRLDVLPGHLFKIVVAHHPLMPPPQLPETRLVARADEALAAFARHGVRLVLSGHLHRAYSRRAPDPMATVLDKEATAAGGAEAKLPVTPLVLHAGSATSTRLRDEPNAYNRITIAEGQVTIEVRSWDGESLFAVATPTDTAAAT